MSQITQELRAWSRVRLNRERTDLDPDDLAYALNADLFLEEGVIRIRRGSSRVYASALADLTVRLVRRFNATRYQVAGTTLYRAGASALTGLHSGRITTMRPYRPLSDTTTWVFIADRSFMKKDDGTTVYPWGLAANASEIGLYAGPAGSLTGTYNARVAPVRFDGTAVAHEGNPCDAGTAVTLASQALGIADIAPNSEADADGIGIYRTVANGATYYRDARVSTTAADDLTDFSFTHPWEVAHCTGGTGLQWQIGQLAGGKRCTQTWEPTGTGNGEDAAGRTGTHPWEQSRGHVTTQTVKYGYVSSLADSALGGEIETDNDAPPVCSWVSPAFNERLWLCQDPDNPHYAWFTKRFRPESVPAENYLELGTPDDALLCIIPYGGVAVAFAGAHKYQIRGSGTEVFVGLEAPSKRGTVGTFTAAAGEDGIYFVARDGIFRTTGYSPDEPIADTILPLFYGLSVNGYAPINWTYAHTFSLELYQDRLYFSYADTASTTPNMVAVNKLGSNRWQFYSYPTGLASLCHERDTGSLSAGGHDGHVYLLETGTDDAGTGIALTADTKDLGHVTEDSPTGVLTRHLFLYAKTDAEPSSGTITETVYVDGAAVSPAYSLTVSRRPTPKRLPATAQGYRWRKRWTYTGSGTVRIYGTSILAEPLRGA